jgi:hypothetical protein
MIIGENEMLRHTYYVKIFIYIVGESIITSFWFGLLKNVTNKIQSVYKRTYIKSPVELCGSIFFLVEICQAVEAGKLDVK